MIFIETAKRSAIIIGLCLLSFIVEIWASSFAPGWLAFCFTVIAYCVVGYPFFANWLAPQTPEQKQSNALPMPAKMTQSSLAVPAQRAKAQSKSRVLRSVEARRDTHSQKQSASNSDNNLIAHLAALTELAGIAQTDIVSVIEAFRAGTPKSKIYLELHWASKKHTTIVKPVVDAYLRASSAKQGVS